VAEVDAVVRGRAEDDLRQPVAGTDRWKALQRDELQPVGGMVGGHRELPVLRTFSWRFAVKGLSGARQRYTKPDRTCRPSGSGRGRRHPASCWSKSTSSA